MIAHPTQRIKKMKKICEYCHNEFEAKRENAKYCDAKCRKLAFLKQEITPLKNAKEAVSVPNTEKKTVSVPNGEKLENVTTRNNETNEVSVPEKTTLPTGGRPEVSVPGRDDPYSPDYDLSEEGFIRRNKNWADFSERFKENVRKDVAEFKIMVAANLKISKLIREEK